MRQFIVAGLALSLGACCTTLPQNEGDLTTIDQVVTKIKQDLAAYQAYDEGEAGTQPLPNACKGAIGFTIDSVKVSLTTQTENSATGSGSATLPVGAGGTLGLTASTLR
jgi:hypothetical protein